MAACKKRVGKVLWGRAQECPWLNTTYGLLAIGYFQQTITLAAVVFLYSGHKEYIKPLQVKRLPGISFQKPFHYQKQSSQEQSRKCKDLRS